MDEENEWKRWMEEVEAVKLEVRKISKDGERKEEEERRGSWSYRHTGRGVEVFRREGSGVSNKAVQHDLGQ